MANTIDDQLTEPEKEAPTPDEGFESERLHRKQRLAAGLRTMGRLHLAEGVAGHVTGKDLLVFDEQGPVGNLLRYKNECARHKLLDLVGDLALVGCDLVGRFVSHRGGHSLNATVAKKLLAVADTAIESNTRRAA